MGVPARVAREPERTSRPPHAGPQPAAPATRRRPGLERRPLARVAPYGRLDLALQIVLWVAYGLAYEAVRGSAGRNAAQALRNGLGVLQAERHLHLLLEPGLQRLVRGTAVAVAVRWSYWASEFAVLVLALTWAYFRDREGYRSFRDAVIVANTLGLLGYLLFPAAPPRLFGGYGFLNSLSGEPRPGHASGLIGFAENPYAAMPSIHAADALLVGVFLVLLVRSRWLRLLWAIWPAWVCFTVLASGNHFWLDVAAGGGVALLALGVARVRAARRSAASAGAGAARRGAPGRRRLEETWARRDAG